MEARRLTEAFSDPLSITTTSAKHPTRERQSGSAAASFRTGITTVQGWARVKLLWIMSTTSGASPRRKTPPKVSGAPPSAPRARPERPVRDVQ
jgi:hypothetical protein